LQMLFDTMFALFCRHSSNILTDYGIFCKIIVDFFSKSAKIQPTL